MPIAVASGAVYPYSEKLAERFTKISRFGDPFSMYWDIGEGAQRRLLLPRGLCPPGEKDLRTPGLVAEFTSSFVARNSEQTRVIQETVEGLQGGLSFIVEAPTGFGKTYCMMPVIAALGRVTAVVVHKEDIRDQWIEAAQKTLGLGDDELGLIQGDVCQVAGKKLVICMLQSVYKDGRYPQHLFDAFGLVIWDEVHRIGADQFSQSAWRFPGLLRLGISATPDRRDGKAVVFKGHIGPVRVVTEATPLTPKILTFHSKWQLPWVNRKVNGHWQQVPLPHKAGKLGHVNKMLARDRMRNQMIAGFVKSAWQKGRSIVVFAELIEHLENLHEAFIMAGIKPGDLAFYIGGLTKQERFIAEGKPVMLATYRYMSEGTDVPWLDTLVMASPRADVKQIVGRILREHDGKKEPVVADIVDLSSDVLLGYFKRRMLFYQTIEAPVKNVAG